MGIDALSDEPVGERDEKQDEQENATGLVVEEPTDRHEEDITQVKSGGG